MDDLTANQLRDLIDAELAKVRGNAHVALGIEAFGGFRDRKWIEQRDQVLVGGHTVIGKGWYYDAATASHDPNLEDLGYRVDGKRD